MPTITYNFDTPSNYIYDNTKIEVVGSVAQLIIGNGILSFNQDFANDVGFIYDNNLIEFVSGVMQQKDQSPIGSVFAATYQAGFDLDWHKSGSVSATLNGIPTNVGGKLVCTGAQGLYYLKNTAATETHKFKYTPNYSGAPPVDVNLVGSHNGSNNNDRFNLINDASGNFRMTIYTASGSAIRDDKTIGAVWSPVSGVEYEIEFVIDSVLGTNRIFIDGILYGTRSDAPWTRGINLHRYWIGASTVTHNAAEASFDDYITFDNAQHAVDYTPGYTLSTLYSSSTVDLNTFTHAQLGGILSFTTFASIESGSARYAFSVGGGALQYWDGSAWVASNGTYAQANDTSTVSANIATLAASGQTMLDVKMIFDNGNVQAIVDDLTVGYTGGTNYPGDNPTIVPVAIISQDGLTSFSASFSAASSDDIRVTFEVGGQQKYWTGATWADSDGTYAQANTISDAQANIAALQVIGILKPLFYLHSNNGGSTPDIDSATIVYSVFGGSPTPENITTVFGYIYNANGVPIANEIITASPQIIGLTNTKQILTDTVSTTSNASGYWELSLVETITSSEQFAYVFKIEDETFLKQLPNQLAIAFNDLIDAT